MKVLMLKNKKKVDELVDKAYMLKKYAAMLVDCIEETIDEMEEKYDDEDNFRDGESKTMYKNRYDYNNRRY